MPHGLNVDAKIAQLVEHDLAKVGVAGSSPVFRSKDGMVPLRLRNHHLTESHRREPTEDFNVRMAELVDALL